MWPRERERSDGDEMRFTFSSCTVCASGLPERLHRSSLNGFLLLLYSPSSPLNSLAHHLCMLFHNQPQPSRWGARARLRHTIQCTQTPSPTRSASWLWYLPKCTTALSWSELVTWGRMALSCCSYPNECWMLEEQIVLTDDVSPVGDFNSHSHFFCLNKCSVLCGAAAIHSFKMFSLLFC